MPTVVPAVRIGRPGREQLRIVCPHCRRFHYHGAVGPQLGAGDGHRAAHCTGKERRPGAEAGYVLHEVTRQHYALDLGAESREAIR